MTVNDLRPPTSSTSPPHGFYTRLNQASLTPALQRKITARTTLGIDEVNFDHPVTTAERYSGHAGATIGAVTGMAAFSAPGLAITNVTLAASGPLSSLLMLGTALTGMITAALGLTAGLVVGGGAGESVATRCAAAATTTTHLRLTRRERAAASAATESIHWPRPRDLTWEAAAVGAAEHTAKAITSSRAWTNGHLDEVAARLDTRRALLAVARRAAAVTDARKVDDQAAVREAQDVVLADLIGLDRYSTAVRALPESHPTTRGDVTSPQVTAPRWSPCTRSSPNTPSH